MTTEATIDRPAPTEYAPYYETYVSQIPDGDIISILERQLDETVSLLRSIPESQGDARYAPEKWSIKELVGHVVDTERIFGYRALRFARNDATPLPGFDQDQYVSAGGFDTYRLDDLATEFEQVRRGHIAMFRHLDDAAWKRGGVASNNPVSVRALAYIMAGHAAHHIQILRALYL